jgi:hypothetical protein
VFTRPVEFVEPPLLCVAISGSRLCVPWPTSVITAGPGIRQGTGSVAFTRQTVTDRTGGRHVGLIGAALKRRPVCCLPFRSL